MASLGSWKSSVLYARNDKLKLIKITLINPFYFSQNFNYGYFITRWYKGLPTMDQLVSINTYKNTKLLF